jgi:hypothetical protein
MVAALDSSRARALCMSRVSRVEISEAFGLTMIPRSGIQAASPAALSAKSGF